MSSWKGACVVFLLVALTPTLASAQGSPLGVEDVVKEAMERSPTIAAQKISQESAGLTLKAEEGRRVPMLSADGGLRLGQTPQQGPQGVLFLTTQALTTNATVAYTSPWGTSLSGGVNLERSVRDSVILGNLGVVWGVGMTLGITQPWLRGFGLEIGEANIRDAEVGVSLARVEQERLARELTRDVRRAYWQLWYADREVEIAKKAMAIAEQAREQGQARVDAGLGAGVDLINLETEIASAQERLVQGASARRARAIELARLMGRGPQDAVALTVKAQAPAKHLMSDMPTIQTRVRESSVELSRLKLERSRAALAAMQAEDQARANLETVATLNVNGLGANAGEALGQFAQFQAIVGYLGVRLDLPLINDTRRAEAERAQLSLRRLEQEQRALTLRLDAQAATLAQDLKVAHERVELARKTATLSQKSVENVQTRFENDQATALEVVQVLQRQREAELRVARALLDRESARLALDAMMTL